MPPSQYLAGEDPALGALLDTLTASLLSPGLMFEPMRPHQKHSCPDCRSKRVVVTLRVEAGRYCRYEKWGTFGPKGNQVPWPETPI